MNVVKSNIAYFLEIEFVNPSQKHFSLTEILDQVNFGNTQLK